MSVFAEMGARSTFIDSEKQRREWEQAAEGERPDTLAVAVALDLAMGQDEWYGLPPGDLVHQGDRIRRRLAGAGWKLVRERDA